MKKKRDVAIGVGISAGILANIGGFVLVYKSGKWVMKSIGKTVLNATKKAINR